LHTKLGHGSSKLYVIYLVKFGRLAIHEKKLSQVYIRYPCEMPLMERVLVIGS